MSVEEATIHHFLLSSSASATTQLPGQDKSALSAPMSGASWFVVSCGPETLIKNYTTHMTGLDATARALETAKGIVDMAQAEASGAVVARGKQHKPDL